MAKKAVVTGASSGIGRAIALGLAGERYNLTIVARRKEELDLLAAEIASRHSVAVDVIAKDLALPNAAADVFKSIDSLDVLVNCAGMSKFGAIESQSEAEWLKLLQLNCLSVMTMCREAVAKMKAGGVIVNISSLSSELPLPYLAAYSGSKAFVTSFSVSLNEELKERKISVVSVNPGGVSTEFTANSGLPDIDKDNKHMLVTPDYIARAVLRAIKKPQPLVIPLRSGAVGRALIWLVPRAVLAKLAGMTYRRYL